jgi:hypothetical protein
MKERFFRSAGVLFTIAMLAISVILGIRSGIMSDSIWEGFKIGGACACGAILFALGMTKFAKSGYDSLIAKILWGVSLIGMTILGVSLVAVSISDIANINPFITENGLMLGAGMFVLPILCAGGYFCMRVLIDGCKKNKRLFCISLGIATILAVAMYLISGTLSDAFAIFFAFLFYWIGICFFIYAWNGVKDDEYVLLWRIGFAMVITFLGCGILYILSAVLVNFPVLSEMLLGVVRNTGFIAMYGLLGYIGLVTVTTMIIRTYRKFTN